MQCILILSPCALSLVAGAACCMLHHHPKQKQKMTTNFGTQAAEAVNEKLVERQKLEKELLSHHQDLGTLTAQRNENEMVKGVREREKRFTHCRKLGIDYHSLLFIICSFLYHSFISHLLIGCCCVFFCLFLY